jgi:hypothetical protein
MLDPRIYRTGLVVVALALIVLAFSFDDQQGALGTTLAPDAFNGQNAYNNMIAMAKNNPIRSPGSAGDDALATEVAQNFTQSGFNPSTTTFTGRTVNGPQTLENVVGVRPGQSGESIVIVAHRDSLGYLATADLSGTATLIELARDLAGETLQRTVVLASTSGSAGTAGAIRLASALGGPVDAVIVLGDLASAHVRWPVIVPWSDGQVVAPTMLRNTLAAALGAQAGIRPGGTSVAGQFLHLAFPFTLSEQAPFGAKGLPAVLLSLSGERGPAADDVPQSPAQITALGRTVLQTISALDGGPSIPAPSAYVLFDGKVLPGWAIRLFVLALILPVLGATIDGLARARRRGQAVGRWVLWVLAGALPFAVAVLGVLGARAVGWINAAPPGPVGPGAVPLHSAGIAVMAGAAVLLVVAFLALRPFIIRLVGGQPNLAHRPGEPVSSGAAAAVLLVLCVVTLAIWFENPFAAALVVPALHLWMWVVTPAVRLRRPAALVLLIAGVAAPALAIVYYALTLGFGPVGVAWEAVLLIAGGHVGLVSALEWSVVLGCVASVVVIALWAARERRPEQAPVTVRGPIGYAGPGSLGGTESALRR